MKYIYGLQKKSLLFLSSPITGEYSVLEEIPDKRGPLTFRVLKAQAFPSC